MPPSARIHAALFTAGLASVLLAAGGPISAQAPDPIAPSRAVVLPQPVMLLGAYVDYPGLLLLPPRGFDLLGQAAAEDQDGRMAAYRDFETSLRQRTAGVASLSGSSEDRRDAKRKIMSDIGERLETLPGGVVLTYGRELWERVQKTTNLDLEGYRLRLQVDDAVHGKLALKVQKRLH